MTRSEERKLIQRACKGERSAAQRLIQAHQQSLYAYLLRLSGRPDVAEDIAQDAFVRVLTNLHRFDPRYRFSTWLFTIAKRLYVNANQKLKPRYDSDLVGAVGAGKASGGFAQSDDETWGAARDTLQEALNQLSEEQRDIVLLFHQQGWPIAAIAEHKNMPEGTVKSHLHRARERMRKHIRAHEALLRSVEEVWR
ncbi:MAG: sigma-70 family RNA polymerase sigma factor [Planctomycetota bacterium]|nr:MAG: sigma-70 family RNA polymerase sigma factor [Planctomycetota bacterium]